MNRPRTNKLQLFEKNVVHFVSCVGRGGASVPNRRLGEGCLSGKVALYLGASSLAILFGAEAEGPGGPRTGKTWFWFLLPKQKGLVCRGETLHKNNLFTFHLEVWVEEGTMRSCSYKRRGNGYGLGKCS